MASCPAPADVSAAARPRLSAWAAAVAFASVLLLLATAGGAGAVDSQLVFVVEQNGAIRLTLPNGAPVGSGPISPGAYAVVVRNPYKDDDGRPHVFHLNGPGVQLIADINQGEQDDTTWTFVFLPSATYTWVDATNPSVAGTFRTAAAASPEPGATNAPPVGGSGPARAEKPKSAVPEPVLPLRGTLVGTVSRAGKLTLTLNGRSVTALRLRAGAYRIRVDDRSRTAAFNVQLKGKPGRTITGLPFVGNRTVTLDLTAGRWMFFSTITKPTRFVVA